MAELWGTHCGKYFFHNPCHTKGGSQNCCKEFTFCWKRLHLRLNVSIGPKVQKFQSYRIFCTLAGPGRVLSSEIIRHDQISSDIIRHYQISSDIIRHGQISSDIIRHDQISSDIIRHDQISPDIIRHDQISSDIIRHDQISSDIIRHDQISSDIIRTWSDITRHHQNMSVCSISAEPCGP